MDDEFVRFHFRRVLDEIGRQLGLAHFGEVRSVRRIIAADDDEQVHRLAQKLFQRILPAVLCVAVFLPIFRSNLNLTLIGVKQFILIAVFVTAFIGMLEVRKLLIRKA